MYWPKRCVPKLFMFVLLASKLVYTLDLDILYIQRHHWSPICDFNYDSGIFKPEQVKPGSTIFARGNNIKQFFAQVNPRIKHPYFLITMDGGILPEFINDPNVIAWFGNESRSKTIHNPKFTMLPLGLYESIEGHHVNDEFKRFRKNPKTHLLYMNFTLKDYGSHRYEIFDYFKNKSYVTVGSKKSFMNYMCEMSQHKFALSPRGDSYDGYRHWEAIMVGTIPIMFSNWPCERLFRDLPVLIVDTWTQLTEEYLKKKYDEIMSKEYDLRPLYIRYWADKINAVKVAWKLKQAKNH